MATPINPFPRPPANSWRVAGVLLLGGLIAAGAIGVFWAAVESRLTLPAWAVVMVPAALSGLILAHLYQRWVGLHAPTKPVLIVAALLAVAGAGWAEWSRFNADLNRRLDAARLDNGLAANDPRLPLILKQLAEHQQAAADEPTTTNAEATPSTAKPAAMEPAPELKGGAVPTSTMLKMRGQLFVSYLSTHPLQVAATVVISLAATLHAAWLTLKRFADPPPVAAASAEPLPE